MTQKLISQGAEAEIYLNSKNNIVKQRIPKSYRIPEIDNKIRIRRTRAEIKILNKLSKIINVPKVFSENKTKANTLIHMEFINGKKLSEELNNLDLKKQIETIKKIAISVEKMHKEGIAHSDLTTSNMILKRDELYLIDFGLSFQNAKYEDKAVDIHLFKQALEAKHFENWKKLYSVFEETYLKQGKQNLKK